MNIPPALLMGMLKQMGFDPEKFKLEVQNAISAIKSFDARLSSIETILKGQDHGREYQSGQSERITSTHERAGNE